MNSKSDEEKKNRDEEVYKSIIKGLARRNRETTRDVNKYKEEEQDVICFDDITGKELPWHAVRKARDLELKYLRDLGVYEKVDERGAIAQYQVTTVDTKWIDTQTKHLRQSPCTSDNELLRESSKETIGQICTQGLLCWKR